MELAFSIAFGIWIVITAFVYRAVTGSERGGGQKK